MLKDLLAPIVGVGVVVFQGDFILVGKRKSLSGKGCWGLPGGRLEYREDPADCAYRELYEETGLTATSCALGPWTNELYEEYHYVSLYVFVHQFEGIPVCMEPEKCEGWIWQPMNALPEPFYLNGARHFNNPKFLQYAHPVV